MNNETFLKQLELDYLARFRAMSANELVECFNREVGSRGWTGSRSAYLSALVLHLFELFKELIGD